MGGALERINFRGGTSFLALEEAVWCRLATKLMGYALTPVQLLALSECTSTVHTFVSPSIHCSRE